MKSFFRAVLCLLACALPAAAANRCIGGNANGSFDLGNGYHLEISAGAGDHSGECHIVIDGKAPLLDVYAYDLRVDEFSGKDVNNDGEPDMIVVGHIKKGDPFTYWIVSFKEPAGVARQIATVYPLTFEDRDGDQKIEIWTREWSYNGIDGLSPDDSPHPLVALRLLGNRLIWVSDRFPLEYDPEIIQAKQRITEDGVNKLKNLTDQSQASVGAAGGGTTLGGGKDDPKMDARAFEAKLGILELFTAYLYAGKNAEAIKALGDWPFRDRDRIRTALIRQRGNGIMRQLTAPQPAPSRQAAAPPPATSQPQ
ncbi:MAG TPA: hypothetical protein VLA96_02855 [Terriglobales bacterium]|jgi:hypothetical protein|nr:hypothetical protein [Terriglobales bacterium]